MTDSIVVDGLEALVKEAAAKAIINRITNSDALKKTVDDLLVKAIKDAEPLIKAAIEAAVKETLANPSSPIPPMIYEALLASSPKLKGQFDAVMKRVGKDLALDRRTLTALAEKVKQEIAAGDEKLGIGQFS